MQAWNSAAYVDHKKSSQVIYIASPKSFINLCGNLRFELVCSLPHILSSLLLNWCIFNCHFSFIHVIIITSKWNKFFNGPRASHILAQTFISLPNHQRCRDLSLTRSVRSQWEWIIRTRYLLTGRVMTSRILHQSKEGKPTRKLIHRSRTAVIDGFARKWVI